MTPAAAELGLPRKKFWHGRIGRVEDWIYQDVRKNLEKMQAQQHETAGGSVCLIVPRTKSATHHTMFGPGWP